MWPCLWPLSQLSKTSKLTWTVIYHSDGSHIFSNEPLYKTVYWLGVCHGWFHLHDLPLAARSGSEIYKMKNSSWPQRDLNVRPLNCEAIALTAWSFRPDIHLANTLFQKKLRKNMAAVCSSISLFMSDLRTFHFEHHKELSWLYLKLTWTVIKHCKWHTFSFLDKVSLEKIWRPFAMLYWLLFMLTLSTYFENRTDSR